MRAQSFKKASGLALRLKHGAIQRLACRLACPDNKLKRREIALAAVQRGREQRLALAAGSLDAAGETEGVAVHKQADLRRQVRMHYPHPLIAAGHKPVGPSRPDT